jgi:uncharacterized protein (TIGR00106 family)
MLAAFSIAPIGVGEELAEPVADVLKIIKDSGLAYKLGAMSTTIEGDPEKVMSLIMKCHNHMRTKAKRVLTSITIDDREGATDRLEGKVEDVEKALKRKV